MCMAIEIRVFYCNTHVGQALREGGVAWALKEYDPDLTFLVEVVRKSAKARIKEIFDPKKYSVTGLLPHGKLEVESGTLIIAKRSVLKRKWWGNSLLTRQRWVDGRRDKWHPIRRLTQALFVFAENHKVRLHVSAVHLWTHLGHALHGPHEVPAEYRKQAEAYAVAGGESVHQGAATLHVGDMNAIEADGTFIADKYAAHAMKVLHRAHLDFVVGSKKVKVLRVIPIPQARLHTDHDGFIVDLEISA